MKTYEIEWHREQLAQMEADIKRVQVWLFKHDPEYKKQLENPTMQLPIEKQINIMELEKALQPGAPLHAGKQAFATQMREFSRPWRRVVENLRLPKSGKPHQETLKTLDMLGIACLRGEGRKIIFQTF